MNVTSEMFKEEKKKVIVENNLCLLLEFVCEKGSKEDWTQTKEGGGNKIVEKNISKKGVEKRK